MSEETEESTDPLDAFLRPYPRKYLAVIEQTAPNEMPIMILLHDDKPVVQARIDIPAILQQAEHMILALRMKNGEIVVAEPERAEIPEKVNIVLKPG